MVHERGLKVRAVAEFISVSESTLFNIYKRKSIDIDKMIRFSQLFDTNLFLYYFDDEPIKSMLGQQTNSLQKQLIDLQTELEAKNQKLKDLGDMIETQKKVIALYEKNETYKENNPRKKK